MRSNFADALARVLKHEGGFVNHPADPGGATNLGVTIGTARRLGIDVDGDGDTDIIDIKKLKPEHAAKVYRHEYWDKVDGDRLPSGVDYAVFDFAVNSGVSRAAKYLQAVVGVTQDGDIGPQTIAAVSRMSAAAVVNELCAKRMAFLKALPTFKTFGRGWTSRVDGVRSHALELASRKPVAAEDRPSGTSTPPEPTLPRREAPSGSLVTVIISLVAAIGAAIAKALGWF